MKRLTTAWLVALPALAASPENVSVGVDADNVPIGETILPLSVDTFVFPASGDTRNTVFENPWNAGDYIEGGRTLTAPASQLDMVLSIDPNLLSCDTQDHVILIDGVAVGEFAIPANVSQLTESFSFPEIAAGDHVIRLETTRTVAPGCGSAGLPDDVSTFTFSDGGCAMTLEAELRRGAIEVELYLDIVLEHHAPRAAREPMVVDVRDVTGRTITRSQLGPFLFQPGDRVEVSETMMLPPGTSAGVYWVVVSVASMNRFNSEVVPVVLH